MQGAVGIKRLLALGACAAGMLLMLLFAAPSASAIAPYPGRMFILSDVGSTRGDLFRSTTSNTWKRLTFGLGLPESVSADPNGKFAVICATKTGGTYRIYRISANGGRMKSLIGNRAGCAPAVSPDGQRVAYIESTGSANLLRVVSTSGGKPRTIRRFCSSCMFTPVWAGKRIYFEAIATTTPVPDFEIYSVRARDGRGLERHTDDGGDPINYYLADVSPNGRNILVGLSESDSSFAPVRNDLVVLSPTGAERFTVVAGSPDYYTFAGAAFSPSGRQVIAEKQVPTETDPYSLLMTSYLTDVPILSFYIPRPAVAGTGAYEGPYAVDWVRR